MDFPLISPNPNVQAFYEKMCMQGQSHNMAEVLATRSFPGFTTNDTFLKGKKTGDQFDDCPVVGQYYREVAESAGVSTTGKVYLRGLANFPGDPRAWVSDKDDVLRVCKERGWSCEGVVNYTPPELPPSPDVKLAPDLVEREVRERLEENPDANPEDIRDTVTQLRSGDVDDHPLLVTDHNFEEPAE
jgi:hypothetical protein